MDEARAAAAVSISSPNALVLLGQCEDQAFDLVVEPAPDVVSRCTVVAVRKIISTAVALERYRREERNRASALSAQVDANHGRNHTSRLVEPSSAAESATLMPKSETSLDSLGGEQPSEAEEVTVRMDQPLADALAIVERAMVRRALERSHGRVEEAARLLGISRKGLFLKRRRWATDARQAS